MKPSNLDKHSWTYNEKVTLFKLLVAHINKYDRTKWKMKYATSPIDYNTEEEFQVFSNIVEDLKCTYEDESFNINGCKFVIQYAISIGDKLSTKQKQKDESRMAALEAGFISDDDFDYISELEDPANEINMKIINNELTPEQMVVYIDKEWVKNVLIQNYPKYSRGEAFNAVLNIHNIKLKDLPKSLKAKAYRIINDFDNAYIQLSKSKSIIEDYILENKDAVWCV
jgi:hypothetical protein